MSYMLITPVPGATILEGIPRRAQGVALLQQLATYGDRAFAHGVFATGGGAGDDPCIGLNRAGGVPTRIVITKLQILVSTAVEVRVIAADVIAAGSSISVPSGANRHFKAADTGVDVQPQAVLRTWTTADPSARTIARHPSLAANTVWDIETPIVIEADDRPVMARGIDLGAGTISWNAEWYEES